MSTDMSQTILAKSDQMNADDLIGRNQTIKISDVRVVAGEQPVAISYEGDNGKPWKPCKTMCRVLVGAWGKDGKNYIGKSLTLHRDPTVTYGGMAVGGIRISHMSDISKPLSMALSATKKSKKVYTVEPLEAAAPPAEEKPPAVTKKNKWQDWGAAFVARLSTTTTVAEVDRMENDVAADLDKMYAESPKFHERIMQRITERRDSLTEEEIIDGDDDLPDFAR